MILNLTLYLQQHFARIMESEERIREWRVVTGKKNKGLSEGVIQRAFAGELSTTGMRGKIKMFFDV
ncbi:hypothetical protein [uncultured Methanoregula sp.]|uniref:hypothetical protein n=1 Tax=uncultured Methanoregula sp. TaxID=1005933 RepID=UPI002AABCC00|nr:hypothetical protein [uncultured Methanoregula sp.]